MPPQLEQLLPRLVSAGDLLRSILSGDQQAVFCLLAADVTEALAAEACAIFVCRAADPDGLTFLAGHPGPVQKHSAGLRLSIQDIHESRWLGEAADRRRPVRTELGEARPDAPDPRAAALAEFGPLRSVLAVPLFDRKGEVQGVLEVLNKQGGEGVAFSDGDERRAVAQAEVVSAALFVFRVLSLAQQCAPIFNSAATLGEVTDSILRETTDIFDADRGDLVVLDTKKGDLVLRCGVGKGRTECEQLPEGCIVRQVWDSGVPRMFPDDAAGAESVPLHPAARSAIAVRWDVNGQRTGVLNLESDREGHFTPFDLTLVHLLGQALAFVYQIFGSQIRLRKAFRDFGEYSAPLPESLQTILESVVETNRFEAALIYLVTSDNKRLECAASIGCPGKGFSYAIGDRSLATQVYRKKKGVYVADPANDPDVCQKGVEHFGICSPLIGVPLLFRGEAVGSLVVWNNRNPGSIQEQCIAELEPFARVAAANIALTEQARQREQAMKSYQATQRAIQNGHSLEENLDLIMQAIQSVAGFDRVRIYDFRESTRRFECRASRGMDQNFRSYSIPLDRAYANDIYTTGLQDSSARIYDPVSHPLGPDPDARCLGKPEHLPWAVLPLRINGTVCGQIAADNAISSRAITRESLDTLTLLGGLAGQALANDRVLFEIRTTRALRTLLDKLALDDPRKTFVRRLLVYATCADALGFSRAVFLEKKEGPGQLEFAAALGSLTSDRHAHVTKAARQKGLSVLLDEAFQLDDPDLERALRGFSLSPTEPSVAKFLRPPGVEAFSRHNRAFWPPWVSELAGRLSADELLIARVGDEREVFGLLIVDRHWQGRDLSQADTRVVETFAQQTAALILRQYSLYQQVLEGRELSTFGFVVASLTHDLGQPIGALMLDTDTFRESVKADDLAEAADCARRIERAIERVGHIVDDLELFLKPHEGLTDTDVRRFLSEIIELSRDRAQSLGVKLFITADDVISPLRLIRQLLRRSLTNLIDNALDAFKRAGHSGSIEVSARLSQGWLAIAVRDDGPGMSAQSLEKLRRRASGFTTKMGKALGFGMAIARRAAEVHQQGDRRGSLDIQSEQPKGILVTLWIPV